MLNVSMYELLQAFFAHLEKRCMILKNAYYY